MSAFANPYLIPELIMNPVPEPGEPPKTKVMVHGLPGSKFTRQHAPTDAAFEHIKDGICNLAQINSPLSSFGFRCWKQRLNQRPLRHRQIARIGKLIHPTTILHAFSDTLMLSGNAFREFPALSTNGCGDCSPRPRLKFLAMVAFRWWLALQEYRDALLLRDWRN